MSISAVVTRGYGNFGSIPEVVTAGYIVTSDVSAGNKTRGKRGKSKKTKYVSLQEITPDQIAGLKRIYGKPETAVVEVVPEVVEVVPEVRQEPDIIRPFRSEEYDLLISQKETAAQQALQQIEEAQEIALILALIQNHVK